MGRLRRAVELSRGYGHTQLAIAVAETEPVALRLCAKDIQIGELVEGA